MKVNKQKILSAVLAAAMSLSCMAWPAFAESSEVQTAPVQVAAANQKSLTFSDVPASHWAYKYVMACVSHGAISGTTPAVNGVGTFDPNGKVTLGHFLMVLTRLIAADKIDESAAGHWAMPGYEAAIAVGLIYEYEYDSSSATLNKVLTREEMALLLTRAAEISGEPLDLLPGIENNIGDWEEISIEKVVYVMRAYSSGLLTGVNKQGDFNPKGNMTRAEMATVVCRLMNYYPRAEVVVQDPYLYISDEGYTKGMLLPKVSREYELKALGATKIGEDSKGVYIIFTAPELPAVIADDFTFAFSSHLYKSNGDYFADPIWPFLKSGESTQRLYFKKYTGGKVTKKDIGSMGIGVYIYANGDVSRHMFVRSIDSDYPTTANGVWYDGAYDYMEFDSSAVWAGLGI